MNVTIDPVRVCTLSVHSYLRRLPVTGIPRLCSQPVAMVMCHAYRSARLFADSHPRQWVDCSSPAYNAELEQTHKRAENFYVSSGLRAR